MPTASLLPRWVLAMLAGLALVVAGCGGDDDDASVSPDDQVAEQAGVTDADDDTAGDDTADEGDAGDDAVLGWQLTGEPGTVVSLETVAVSDGTEQPSMDQELTLEDEPVRMLFTVFVDSAEVSLAVTAGGPVTAEAIRGRALDPEDPFAGVEVVEVLGSVEVPAGGAEVVLQVG